ncbi:MAG: hypothetical protein GFH25_541324n23 [Chloroflexi bacterium AL-N10]|nr:hypothetical protein [Chloroflexi bacterium AL-N10]
MDRKEVTVSTLLILYASMYIYYALTDFFNTLTTTSKLEAFNGTIIYLSISSAMMFMAWALYTTDFDITNRTKNQEKRNRKKYKKLSINSIIRERKLMSFIFSSNLLLAALLICLLFNLHIAIQMICSILILLYTIQMTLFNYRLLKGFYGTTEYEAREIIGFIINNSENIDFTDGEKKEKLSSNNIRELAEKTKNSPRTTV